MLIAALAAAALAALAVCACAAVRIAVARGRPAIDGDLVVAGIGAGAVVRRDDEGVAEIRAADRTDAAFATGFVHAQERFFQMDVSRRIGAGELAELFGPKILPVDRMLRVHRFRTVAEQAWQSLGESDRRLLSAYAAGVNAGLGALRVRPFEYFVTRSLPRRWCEVDSLLVVHSLYVLLQDGRGDQKFHLQKLYDHLPAALADFLAPTGAGEWDAPIDGGPTPVPPVPGPDVFSCRGLAPGSGEPDCEPPMRGLMNGSNCWAVGGRLTADGRAILANDLHLPFGMPNPFFRAAVQYAREDGTARRLCGFTVPGYPLVVTGSNGDIAWGFSNSAADWVDLVMLDGSAEETHEEIETIRVKGGKRDVTLTIGMTRWGPVVREDERGRRFAQRWVAHFPDAVNLELRRVEEARDAREALDAAPRCGIPAQNFHVADRDGNIGWTIAGRIPRRERTSRLPMPPAAAGAWHGWLEPREYPVVLNPPSGRIWTANARAVGPPGIDLLGHGHYVLGARARQIRDGLAALDRIGEAECAALQLDDRAIFLERWKELLLETLRQAPPTGERARLQACMLDWSGRAAAASSAYRAVRAFRSAVHAVVFEPFLAYVTARSGEFDFAETGDQSEAPLWRMVGERPAHLVPSRFANWDEALRFAADAAARHLARRRRLRRARTWGEYNRLRMQHPFSLAIPIVGRFLDMRAVPLNGDLHMPLSQIAVHGPAQRMVVAPGHEAEGTAHLAGGQASNPLAPYFGGGHERWLKGTPGRFLPGVARYELRLVRGERPRDLSSGDAGLQPS